MAKYILFTCLLMCGLSGYCDHFYWSGASGVWSDTTQWRKTSGGQEQWDRLPVDGDQVIINVPSGGTITVDILPTIETLQVSGGTINFSGSGFLSVTGDIVLHSGTRMNIDLVLCPPELKSVTFNGGNATLKKVALEGMGTVSLTSNLNLETLNIQTGILLTNSRSLYFKNIQLWPGAMADFGRSQLNCNGGTVMLQGVFLGTDYHVFLNQAIINSTGLMAGLTVTGECSSNLSVNTDTLVVTPGSKFNVYADTIKVHKQLYAVGTEEALVFMGVWRSGYNLNLVCGGEVTVDYAVLRNLHNRSSQWYTANHSVDMGNNLKWHFNLLRGEDYVWNKAEGIWDDLASWPGHKRLPTAVDNVYINCDAQISSKNIFYNACRDLKQKEGTTISLYAIVDVFGDVNLPGKGVAAYVRMFSTDISTCFVSDKIQILEGVEMNYYSSPDGQQNNRFDLKSDVVAPVMYVNGSLLTNGYRVVADQIQWHKVADNIGTFDIRDSDITTRLLVFECDNILSERSKITAIGGAYKRMLVVGSEEVTGSIIPARDFLDDKAEVQIEGDTIHYLVMKDRGTIRDLKAFKLELSPDCDVSLYRNITVKQLIIQGKPDSLIKISSVAAARTITLLGGDQQVAYALVNNLKIRGATITAHNSYFFNDYTGWTVKSLTPQTCYWVGGSGNWSDLAHWATTSGGNVKSGRIPLPCDPVVIDGNSGLTANDTINFNLLNNVASDLRVEVPCVFYMNDRGRKLNLTGDFILADGVRGQLYELWLWGNVNGESQLRLTEGLNIDMTFQLDGKYKISNRLKSTFLKIYKGNTHIQDAGIDLFAFRALTDDSVHFKNCTVDVTDWRVENGVKVWTENTLISVYPDTIDMPPVSKPVAFFWPSPESLCDRVHFYGGVSARGFKGSSLYVSPYSSVNFISDESELDTLIILGAIENPTVINYIRAQVKNYAYINGATLRGMELDREFSAWHSKNNALNVNVRFETKEPYTNNGVQILEGEHICKEGETSVRLLTVLKDRFQWYRNDTLIGSVNQEELRVDRGGKYICELDGKMRKANTNVFEVMQEHDFISPALSVVGDTVACVVPDPVFNTTITATNLDNQSCRGYRWYCDGNLKADGASPVFLATEEGIYTVELYGLACKNHFKGVGLHLAYDIPDAGLIDPLPVDRHCPGDTISIGLAPIIKGLIPVHYYWTKENLDLDADTNLLRVAEDGMYTVTIGNVCGKVATESKFDVLALIPPVAPMQDSVAAHCGPGDVRVYLIGTNGNQMRWFDGDGELVNEGLGNTFVYPDVQKDERVYVTAVDRDGCVSEKAWLDLKIYDVAALNIGEFVVSYKDSIWLEPQDVPLNGAYQWLPCDEKLEGCTSRVPLFRAGTDVLNKYRLEYTSPDGCVSVDSTIIKMIVEYKFPAVFTPNGDGYNDRWEIFGIELCPENQLTLYDRLGKQIYLAKPYQNDWEGKSDKGEQLPPGTYVYHFTPDGVLKLTGMVSVIRK